MRDTTAPTAVMSSFPIRRHTRFGSTCMLAYTAVLATALFEGLSPKPQAWRNAAAVASVALWISLLQCGTVNRTVGTFVAMVCSSGRTPRSNDQVDPHLLACVLLGGAYAPRYRQVLWHVYGVLVWLQHGLSHYCRGPA